MPSDENLVPYIVSEDIHILLKEWAQERGFTLPPASFFDELRVEMKAELSRIFGKDSVIMISVDDIASGIGEIVEGVVSGSDLPIVSLDNVYYRSELTIEMNRAVDSKHADVGVVPRYGHQGLDEQILSISKRGISKIILVDDVLFSGSSMIVLIGLLEDYGISVDKIISGIAMKSAVLEIQRKTGVEVLSWMLFNKVIDEVCERDFYPGVPYSGRYLHLSDNVGLSYVHPIGDPVNWASIPPEFRLSFSNFCLNQTSKLFAAISSASNRDVLYKDIDRKLPLHLEGASHSSVYHFFLLGLIT